MTYFHPWMIVAMFYVCMLLPQSFLHRIVSLEVQVNYLSLCWDESQRCALGSGVLDRLVFVTLFPEVHTATDNVVLVRVASPPPLQEQCQFVLSQSAADGDKHVIAQGSPQMELLQFDIERKYMHL